MKIWIQFRDGRVVEEEVDSFQSGHEIVLDHGLNVQDWDITSFRAPPSPPEKAVYQFMPL